MNKKKKRKRECNMNYAKLNNSPRQNGIFAKFFVAAFDVCRTLDANQLFQPKSR